MRRADGPLGGARRDTGAELAYREAFEAWKARMRDRARVRWLPIAIAAVALFAPLARADEPAKPLATLSIDVHIDALTPGSSEGTTRSVAIPSACTYVSHRLELLTRHPASPLSTHNDASTSYRDELRRDPSGRVTAVALTLNATMPAAAADPSSIGLRMSVVMRCDY